MAADGFVMDVPIETGLSLSSSSAGDANIDVPIETGLSLSSSSAGVANMDVPIETGLSLSSSSAGVADMGVDQPLDRRFVSGFSLVLRRLFNLLHYHGLHLLDKETK